MAKSDFPDRSRKMPAWVVDGHAETCRDCEYPACCRIGERWPACILHTMRLKSGRRAKRKPKTLAAPRVKRKDLGTL
ncbi:MAG: hypothetical protein IKE76_08845 [Clostridia bacterium]|nr:hypothetical protein [Clostridia bacterium]